MSARRSQLPRQVQRSSIVKWSWVVFDLRIVSYSSMPCIVYVSGQSGVPMQIAGVSSFSSFQYCTDVVTVETLVWCLTIQPFYEHFYLFSFIFQYSSLSGPPPDPVQSS